MYPVEDLVPRFGLGRVGELNEQLTVGELARLVAKRCGLPSVQWSGDAHRVARRVAVVPGSGHSLLDLAGEVCEVLITGDLGYHDAERATDAGLSLVVAPHGDLEWFAFREWIGLLRSELASDGVDLCLSRTWRSPWCSPDSETENGCPQTAKLAQEGSPVPAAEFARLRVDGGSRGNPGPSAIGVVLENAEGVAIEELSSSIGVTTNNVAEYRALLAGLDLAQRHGVRKVEVFSDSELLVKQMRGEYRVKNEGLRPLYEQARQQAARFEQLSIRHVGREYNARADELVNLALDQ